MGERRKDVEKEKVYYGVIITESPEEKMVKLCQFSETRIKTLTKKKEMLKSKEAGCESTSQVSNGKDFQLLCVLNTNRNLEIKCQQMKAKH